MSRHTKEPWREGVDGHILADKPAHKTNAVVAEMCNSNGPADMKRIVACVNALAGIENPQQQVSEWKLALEQAQAELAEYGRTNEYLRREIGHLKAGWAAADGYKVRAEQAEAHVKTVEAERDSLKFQALNDTPSSELLRRALRAEEAHQHYIALLGQCQEMCNAAESKLKESQAAAAVMREGLILVKKRLGGLKSPEIGDIAMVLAGGTMLEIDDVLAKHHASLSRFMERVRAKDLALKSIADSGPSLPGSVWARDIARAALEDK